VQEYYWVNDLFFNEENPYLEVGFNGGCLTIKEIGKDSVWFAFGLTCGPTYHTADLAGIAIKTGPNIYEYKQSPIIDGEICHVTFTFSDKHVELGQPSGSTGCGFGARAFAYGIFQKVNNLPVRDDDERISIEQALGLK